MTAEYFDQWYADIARSDARQRLFSNYLNVPPEVGPSNLLPLNGLQAVAAALGLEPGNVLVDLACGRGGPGMWLARQAGARLIGVDISAEAVAQASDRRRLFGLTSSAAFQLGSLEASDLPDGVADGVVCVDAFQFAADGVAAATEIKRILQPGGRVVLTCWEAVDRADQEISERIRKVDLAGSLEAAGFSDVSTNEKPNWHDAARSLNEAAIAMDPSGDPALESLHSEAVRTLPMHDRVRRVMATATAP